MLQQVDAAIAFTVVMLMLSLMVTAAVQVVTALTDLRGRNLASGLENLMSQIDPEFREKLPDGSSTIAQHIAQVVVKHPAIAHAGTRAKAVGKGELMTVLRDLSSDKPAAAIQEDAKVKLRASLNESVPGVGQSAAAISKLERGVGQWFDIVMDRLSDIFTRHTRVITVTLTVLFVVSLHIDSGEILRQITSSPDVRAKLVALSDSTLSQTDKTFENTEPATVAIAEIRKHHPNRAGEPQIMAALDKVPTHLTRCADGNKALAEAAKTLPDAEPLLDEFDHACQGKTGQAVDNAYDQIRSLSHSLETTGLQISPAEINGQSVFDSVADWGAAYGVGRHFAGTLATIFLLSLGAPFWFNALRQLSNLKPAISEKISKKESDK